MIDFDFDPEDIALERLCTHVEQDEWSEMIALCGGERVMELLGHYVDDCIRNDPRINLPERERIVACCLGLLTALGYGGDFQVAGWQQLFGTTERQRRGRAQNHQMSGDWLVGYLAEDIEPNVLEILRPGVAHRFAVLRKIIPANGT